MLNPHAAPPSCASTSPAQTAPPLVGRIALDHIAPDPDQPRRTIDTEGPEWEGLVGSIKKFGLLQPILVRPDPQKEGHYILICGERRWRAAKAAGRPSILVKIVYKEMVIAHKAELQLAENALREGLSPLDEMEACVRLLAETGKSKIELARLLGGVKSTVSNILRLDRIHSAIRERIRGCGVKFSRRQLWRVADGRTVQEQHAALDALLGVRQAPAAGEGLTDTQQRGSTFTREFQDEEQRLVVRVLPGRGRRHAVSVTIRGLADPARLADVLRFIEMNWQTSECRGQAG